MNSGDDKDAEEFPGMKKDVEKFPRKKKHVKKTPRKKKDVEFPWTKNKRKSRDNVVRVDSFVWAKMRGFPYWPGKVLKEEFRSERNEYTGKKAKVFMVYFYGSHDHSFIEEKYVCLYDEGKDLYSELDPAKCKKITPKRRKDFELGLEEIESSLKTASLEAGLELLQKKGKNRKSDGKVVLGVLGSGTLYLKVLKKCAEALRSQVPDWDVSEVIARQKMSTLEVNFDTKKDLLTYEENASKIIEKSNVIVSCYPDVDSLKASNNFEVLTKEMIAFKTYIEMTPLDIKTEDENLKAITGMRGTYVQAPVLCPKTFTEEEKITVMVGGEHADAHITNISRFIKVFASPIITFDGTKMSLIIHMMMGSALACMKESMTLADKFDLDQPSLMEVLRMIVDCPLISNKGCELLNSDGDLTSIENCMKYALCMGTELLQNTPVSCAAHLMLSQIRKKKASREKTGPVRNTRNDHNHEKPYDLQGENPVEKHPISVNVSHCGVSEKERPDCKDMNPESIAHKNGAEKPLMDLRDDMPVQESSISVNESQCNMSHGERPDKQEIFPERNEQNFEKPLLNLQGKTSVQESLISTHASEYNKYEGKKQDSEEFSFERNTMVERGHEKLQDAKSLQKSSVSLNMNQSCEPYRERLDVQEILPGGNEQTSVQESSIPVNVSQCSESGGKKRKRQETVLKRNTRCKRGPEKPLDLQDEKPVISISNFASQSSESDDSDSGFIFISRYPSDTLERNKKGTKKAKSRK